MVPLFLTGVTGCDTQVDILMILLSPAALFSPLALQTDCLLFSLLGGMAELVPAQQRAERFVQDSKEEAWGSGESEHYSHSLHPPVRREAF